MFVMAALARCIMGCEIRQAASFHHIASPAHTMAHLNSGRWHARRLRPAVVVVAGLFGREQSYHA